MCLFFYLRMEFNKGKQYCHRLKQQTYAEFKLQKKKRKKTNVCFHHGLEYSMHFQISIRVIIWFYGKSANNVNHTQMALN